MGLVDSWGSELPGAPGQRPPPWVGHRGTRKDTQGSPERLSRLDRQAPCLQNGAWALTGAVCPAGPGAPGCTARPGPLLPEQLSLLSSFPASLVGEATGTGLQWTLAEDAQLSLLIPVFSSRTPRAVVRGTGRPCPGRRRWMAAEATAGRRPSALMVARDQGPQQVRGGRGVWGACRDTHRRLAAGVGCPCFADRGWCCLFSVTWSVKRG